MVGEITGKMFDHPIEKDCVSDLSDPGSCRIGPVRQLAGPESAAIKNLAAVHWCAGGNFTINMLPQQPLLCDRIHHQCHSKEIFTFASV